MEKNLTKKDKNISKFTDKVFEIFGCIPEINVRQENIKLENEMSVLLVPSPYIQYLNKLRDISDIVYMMNNKILSEKMRGAIVRPPDNVENILDLNKKIIKKLVTSRRIDGKAVYLSLRGRSIRVESPTLIVPESLDMIIVQQGHNIREKTYFETYNNKEYVITTMNDQTGLFKGYKSFEIIQTPDPIVIVPTKDYDKDYNGGYIKRVYDITIDVKKSIENLL